MAAATPHTGNPVTQRPSEQEHSAVTRAIDAVWRIESAKLIAGLARFTGDVSQAEDLAQDALLIALERWPSAGIPDNPAAWLMATAKHRAIDAMRRGRMSAEKHAVVASHMEAARESADIEADLHEAIDDHVGDDLLRLIFTSCHPVLSMDSRVALTLRLLGGLTTDEIARAFVAAESAIAQRIVRAKKTLTDAHVPFEVPRGEAFHERLGAVLQVIYLIFNEGYAATAGDDWMRPALCEDALRLGRILAELVPDEPEVHGLVSLMEIQSSRAAARTDAAGNPVLLLEQNRARWNRLLIQRGLAALARAERTLIKRNETAGTYVLQAAIAACHARANIPEQTDWNLISRLYDVLQLQMPTPVVALNRAVAVGMDAGPAAALVIVDEIIGNGALKNYHLLPAVRGDLLFKLDRFDEAAMEFERAAGMTRNERERALLRSRSVDARSRTESHKS
jgi:RNA polymerase sigma factor (sigma-70 family)